MMATITVDDEVYERLTQRAAVQQMTVEAVIEELASRTPPVSPAVAPSVEEKLASFREWMAAVAARADRYPPGFEADASYEAIYGDR